MCVCVCVWVGVWIKRCGIENPSFHHSAEECQHDVWGHSSFKKLCSIHFYQASCSLHTHTHTHAHTCVHTHTQTHPCIPERSLWGLLVHHFGYYPSLVVKYLCPADSLLMRRFFSGPHEFFRWPIALLHWSPRSLRWADGSEPETSGILLTPQRGEFVCQSSSSRVCSRHTHTHTHTHAAWLRIPSKPSKPMLFCLLFCLCAAIFLSLFTFHSEFSLKCKGFFFASLTYFSSICQFPLTALKNYLLLGKLCKFVFLCSSLVPSLLLESSSGPLFFLSWGKYKYISCIGPITHTYCFCELFTF